MAKGKAKLPLILLKGLVSSALLILVLKKAGTKNILNLLSNMDPLLFLTAVFLYILSLYISSKRWQVLSTFTHSTPAWKRLFLIYWMGSFFNYLLPGIVGGDTVRVYYLYRETKDTSSAFGSTFLDRYTGYIGLLVVGLTGLALGYKDTNNPYVLWFLPAFTFIFLIGSLFVFTLRIGKRFSFVSGFYNYYQSFIRDRRVLAKSVALSVLIQIIGITSVFVICKGLSVEIPFKRLLLFVPIIVTASAIPITISGVGLRETAFILLFSLSGIEPDKAGAVSLAWFFSYMIGSSPGGVIYLLWKSPQKGQDPFNYKAKKY